MVNVGINWFESYSSIRRWVGPHPKQLTVVKLSSLFIICKIKLLLKCFLFDLKVQLREEHVVSISLGQHKKEIACIISHFFSEHNSICGKIIDTKLFNS